MKIDRKKQEISIKSWIENQDGNIVIQGQAVAGLLRGFKEKNNSGNTV